jgi:glycosyltransferase involved in cell wall biosynthesis
LSAIRPNVVFVNGWGFHDSRRIIYCATRRRIPICLFSDSRAGDAKRRWFTEWVKRRLVRLCRAAVVAGPEHGDYLESLGMPKERIFDGLDVVDNGHFRRGADAAQAGGLRDSQFADHPFFLYVGRFVEKKNVLALVDAYAEYRRSFPLPSDSNKSCWSLVLVGQGPLESSIRERIGQLGMQAEVQVLPFRQYSELPAIYSAAECLVVPSSHSEQWALVVNEAMAAGLPVLVSSACGCVASLVQHGCNGFVFDPAVEGELTLTLSRFASQTEQARRAMAARSQEIISCWDLDRFVNSVRAAVEISIPTGCGQADLDACKT